MKTLRPVTERYAIADGLSVAAVLTGGALFITYGFGSAVIHAGHDNGGVVASAIDIDVLAQRPARRRAAPAAHGGMTAGLGGSFWRMRILMPLLIVVAVLFATGPAHAQPSAVASTPPPPAPTRTERYGWQTGLVDLAAVGTAVLGFTVFLSQLDMGESMEDGAWSSSGTDGAKLAAVAGSIYVFGGPIIHSLHGNSSGAGKSLVVRVGLPLVGVLAGLATDEDAAVGMVMLAVPTAMIIDAAVFAKREVPAHGRVTPFAAPNASGGVTLGVAGSF